VTETYVQTVDPQTKLSRACVVHLIVGVSAFGATAVLLSQALVILGSI
jgi:hypothetical protein